MANKAVSIFIRFTENGVRRTVPAAYAGNSRLKPRFGIQKGKEFPCPGGNYWIRWYDGTRSCWKKIGPDPTDAMKAQMRQEAVLAGDRVPAQASSSPAGTHLASA